MTLYSKILDLFMHIEKLKVENPKALLVISSWQVLYNILPLQGRLLYEFLGSLQFLLFAILKNPTIYNQKSPTSHEVMQGYREGCRT
jgi:hypothetical protein